MNSICPAHTLKATTLCEIFSYFDSDQMAACERTCKSWRLIADFFKQDPQKVNQIFKQSVARHMPALYNGLKYSSLITWKQLYLVRRKGVKLIPHGQYLEDVKSAIKRNERAMTFTKTSITIAKFVVSKTMEMSPVKGEAEPIAKKAEEAVSKIAETAWKKHYRDANPAKTEKEVDKAYEDRSDWKETLKEVSTILTGE